MPYKRQYSCRIEESAESVLDIGILMRLLTQGLQLLSLVCYCGMKVLPTSL